MLYVFEFGVLYLRPSYIAGDECLMEAVRNFSCIWEVSDMLGEACDIYFLLLSPIVEVLPPMLLFLFLIITESKQVSSLSLE